MCSSRVGDSSHDIQLYTVCTGHRLHYLCLFLTDFAWGVSRHALPDTLFPAVNVDGRGIFRKCVSVSTDKLDPFALPGQGARQPQHRVSRQFPGVFGRLGRVTIDPHRRNLSCVLSLGWCTVLLLNSRLVHMRRHRWTSRIPAGRLPRTSGWVEGGLPGS